MGLAGIYAGMAPDERIAFTRGVGRAITDVQQRYPILAEAKDFLDANAEKLARAIGGIRGAGTEGDVQRAKAIFPELSSALGVRWKGWIPLPSQSMPDTRAVALGKLNAYNKTLDAVAGKVLGNPAFVHPGLLPRLAEPAVSQDPATMKQSGTSPSVTPPAGPATASPIPNDRRAVEATQKATGLTGVPNPQTAPQDFQRYMTTLRQQLSVTRKGTPPAQLDAAVAAVAKAKGGTWQPTP